MNSSISLVFVLMLNYLGLNHAISALITSPPKIIKQSKDNEILFQVASLGDTEKSLILECEAEGEPAPSFRWIKNGKHFDVTAYDDRITQHPGRGTLTITKPRDEDVGEYQCYAENAHGVASSNSIFARKAFLDNFKVDTIQTLKAEEGSPFQLKCQPPDGYPKPAVHWMIQTTSGFVKTVNNSRMSISPDGSLWFSNVTRSDASDDSYYACSAASTFRSEYKLGNRVLLKVIPVAKATELTPTRQYISRGIETVVIGTKTEIFCIFGGTPLPEITWTKRNQPISWSDRITQGNYGKSLIMHNTRKDDEGPFKCVASNGVGQDKSSSISLVTKSRPYFSKEPFPKNATEDGTVVFECDAKGIPEPAIKWIHNGKPIEQTAPNPRRTVSKNKIIIRNLLKEDTGNYGCNATNALGYVYKDVYVNVLALLGETIDHRFTKSSDHSLTISSTIELDEASASATLTVQEVSNAPAINSEQTTVPDMPYFGIGIAPSDNGFDKAEVTWRPNYNNDKVFLDVTIVPSDSDNLYTAGWFIGMILAIAFLILLPVIICIICIIKRDHGAKYDVYFREISHGRQDYPDEGEFHECNVIENVALSEIETSNGSATLIS